MLTPLSSNPTGTVFMVQQDNPKADFAGQFRPSLLKEWAEEVLQNFGDEDVVYLYIHPSGNPDTARFVSASMEHGAELQICVAGVDNDDVIDKKDVKKL